MAEISDYTQEVQRLNIVSEPEAKYVKQPLAVRTNRYYTETLKAPTHYWGLEKVVIMLVGCQMSGKTHFTQKLQRTLARCVIQSRDFICIHHKESTLMTKQRNTKFTQSSTLS